MHILSGKNNSKIRLFPALAIMPLFLLFCYQIPVSVNQPLDAPTGVTAIAVSESSINVSWKDITQDVEGFIVERSATGGNTAIDWTAVNDADINTYNDTNLSPQTNYYYRVMAYSGNIKSNYSAIVNATTQAAGTPAAPSGFSASVLSSSSIRLTWTDNSDNETGFRIERASDSGGNPDTWGEIDTTAANVTSYINSGCASATKYHYRVRAYKGVVNSEYTDIVPATTLAVTTSGSTIADYLVAKDSVLRGIPDEYINTARTSFRIAYFHTSHGTHVSYGIFGLPGFKSGDDIKFGITNNTTRDPSKLDFHDYGPYGLSISGYNDLSQADANWNTWLDQVRVYLDNDVNDYINVMVWSWCDITNHNVSNYLSTMGILIGEYGSGGSKIGIGSGKTKRVPVTFIFMTGHAVGNANAGTGRPKDQAQLIVNYCNSHSYYCLDYYSIDTHTMDDVYYEDTNDDGVSATGGSFYLNWQNTHAKGTYWYDNRTSPGGTVSVGEHNNQHITANRKAFAFWWILARLAGWDGN